MQKRYGRIVIGAFVLATCLIGGWYIYVHSRAKESTAKLHVVATFFPLADFARSVGGENAEVLQIVPDGVEPHEYEPSSQDVIKMLSADVVLINGGGVDAWAEKLIPDAEAAGVAVVRMSDHVSFLEHEGSIDPHAWLDVARAREMAQAIGESFAAQDQEHASFYEENMHVLQNNLLTLDADFQATLSACKSHTIFVAHNAFAYWSFRYTIDVHAVSGISPEAEPSVQDLALLIQEAKSLGVTTIFFESPASTALATTIATEIGAVTDVLNPLESRTPEQVAGGATYLTLMREDLHALAKALTCQP